MSSARYHSSSPDPWVLPRPSTDACTRRYKHGPLQPMDYKEPSFLRRLFGRQCFLTHDFDEDRTSLRLLGVRFLF